jgi:hypothetical protein
MILESKSGRSTSRSRRTKCSMWISRPVSQRCGWLFRRTVPSNHGRPVATVIRPGMAWRATTRLMLPMAQGGWIEAVRTYVHAASASIPSQPARRRSQSAKSQADLLSGPMCIAHPADTSEGRWYPRNLSPTQHDRGMRQRARQPTQVGVGPRSVRNYRNGVKTNKPCRGRHESRCFWPEPRTYIRPSLSSRRNGLQSNDKPWWMCSPKRHPKMAFFGRSVVRERAWGLLTVARCSMERVTL